MNCTLSNANGENLLILGSAIHSQSINKSPMHNFLSTMSKHLKIIDSHSVLFLLYNVLALPRLLFTLLRAPWYTLSDSLQRFDEITRNAAEAVCNVIFDDPGFAKRLFQIFSHGGLGLWSASDLAVDVVSPLMLCSLSTFLSSDTPRHWAFNDVIKRAPNSAEFHAILEPVGLDRRSGKLLVALNVFPFQSGKSFVWNAIYRLFS